jgi:pilus assembly protein FimV
MFRYYSWRLGALAAAMALLVALSSSPAHALGLGRITVQSALGEVLRAEIDVPEITAEEAASLRVGIASVDAFKAAGFEYTAAVVSIQVTLQRYPDGRSFLRLSSSRPVTEPYIDLILEAAWASGRVVRGYTMLFDPPNLQASSPGVAPISTPTSPALSRSALSRSAAPPVAGMASPAAPASSGKKVAVVAGDTAGKIAAQNKSASISLDQMLLAMLRSNPDAFIAGNVNRLKSGVVLDIPNAEEASTLSTSEAASTIMAQAKDFNDFRKKLAAGVPTAQIGTASRKADGKLQANIEDRATVAAAPDKLTLSKGTVQDTAVAEDKIAKEKQAKDASNRVAELAKNIAELNTMAGTPAAPAAAATASASASASASKTPTVPGVQVAAVPGLIPAPASPASAVITTAAVPPALVASAPAVAAPAASAPVDVKKPAVAPPSPSPEPRLLDALKNNPLVLPGLGLLLALLAGFGFYRYKKRNDEASVDSAFLESKLPPDSFFDASGGQRIDTSKGAVLTGSSMVYATSQLDTAGDVDPVAEADVYLAYGRDVQAEEILKEALRSNPPRLAIHAKLMEIYAKRLDLKSFESIATDAYQLTRGSGPEWAYICELGRALDPTNPMYQPGGQPPSGNRASDLPASLAVTASVPQILAPQPDPAALSVDFDLDLDFAASDEPLHAAAAQPTTVPEFSLPSAPVPAPIHNSGMLAFDMGSLSLELGTPSVGNPRLAKAAVTTAPAMLEDPLETKFALAEEFRALGDSDGARSLASEVVAQADGALKSKAQAFLDALS